MERSPRLSVYERLENKMLAFIRRFLLHYPLGRVPSLRNAWRAAQP